ncbi:helix-turn-helix transcriptional regulator [Aureimonas sp. AU40]|uniref:helix-turn-helix transcriptional regulator n=1 Tax=Aureimonas sp. AU40 TaxID=1637747 RepID=UPI0012E3A12B|nr:hypothetical protein [Aureimonas sp. AU40]
MDLSTTDRSLSPLLPVTCDHDAVLRHADLRSLRFGDGAVRQVLSVGVDVFASLLGVAARSLYRWIADGQMPSALAVEASTRRPRYTVAEVCVYGRLVEAVVLAHRLVDGRRLFDPAISPAGQLYAARVEIARHVLQVRP